MIPKQEQEIFGQITIDMNTLVKEQFHYTDNNLRPYITPRFMEKKWKKSQRQSIDEGRGTTHFLEPTQAYDNWTSG